MSTPLNPSATIYEPLYLYQPPPLPLHYFPFYLPEPLVYSHASLLPRHPHNPPNFFPCAGRKKNGKCAPVPPRLRKHNKNYLTDTKSAWVEKQVSEKIKPAGFPVNGGLSAYELDKFSGKTSVMIRNIPKSFKRIDLQSLLDLHCKTENLKARFCNSAYDFLYLPMDFGFDTNLGFAFVNFTTPVAAVKFYKAYNKREWGCICTRKKFCEIGVANFQGKYLKEKFQDSVFPCRTDEYLPLVFSPPRDGFNDSTASLIGIRTRTVTPRDGSVRVMIKRKLNKEVMN